MIGTKRQKHKGHPFLPKLLSFWRFPLSRQTHNRCLQLSEQINRSIPDSLMNPFLTVNTFCSLLWALTFSFPKKVTNSCHLLPQTNDHQCNEKSWPFQTYWRDIKSQQLLKPTFLCYWVHMNTVNNTGRIFHNILSSVSFQRSLLTPVSQKECVDTGLGPKRWPNLRVQRNSLGENCWLLDIYGHTEGAVQQKVKSMISYMF